MVGATTLDEYRRPGIRSSGVSRCWSNHCRSRLRWRPCGLKERYETITVSASKTRRSSLLRTSDRHLTGRHLPDKAIDLSTRRAPLRIEIDSVPTEIDVVSAHPPDRDRAPRFAKETDAVSGERLQDLDREIADQEELAGLTVWWQSEKDEIESLQTINEELDQLRGEVDRKLISRRPSPLWPDP